MIPADDIPALPQDRLDQINAELAQEAEERRMSGEDHEPEDVPEGVIRFAPRDAERPSVKIFDDGEADLPRTECRVKYLPGDGPETV